MSTIPEPLVLTDEERREIEGVPCGAVRDDYGCDRLAGHDGRHVDGTSQFAWEDRECERTLAALGEHGPGPAYNITINRDEVIWQGKATEGMALWAKERGFERVPVRDHDRYRYWAKDVRGLTLRVVVEGAR